MICNGGLRCKRYQASRSSIMQVLPQNSHNTTFPHVFLISRLSNFAVPIWKGTRPYQQIPFQFSCHALSPTGELSHSEFLDLSGDDPSEPFAEALIAACAQVGPVFVYNAGFEARPYNGSRRQIPAISRSSARHQ